MKARWLLCASLWLLFLVASAHAAQENATVEVKVKTLMLDPNSETPVVILETVADKRLLPIWIDLPEARAIAMELEGVKLPRPLTHDLIREILRALGATVQRITITELRNNTYYAVLNLNARGQELQLDSRPSDAIAVALRMKAPIYVSNQVLEKSKPVPIASSRAEQTQKRLGLQIQDLTPELASLMNMAQSKGILIADIAPNSAAAKAGLKRGDIVTKFNNRALESVSDLESAVKESTSATNRGKLEVLRNGNLTTVAIEFP